MNILKNTVQLLIAGIVSYSCTTTKAVTSQFKTIYPGIRKVTPKWKKEISIGKSLIYLGTSATAGAILGSAFIPDSEDLDVSPASYGVSIASAIPIVHGYSNLSKSRNQKPISVNPSELDKWLRKYN